MVARTMARAMAGIEILAIMRAVRVRRTGVPEPVGHATPGYRFGPPAVRRAMIAPPSAGSEVNHRTRQGPGDAIDCLHP